MSDKYSLHNLPEGVGVVLIVLATVILARIINALFDRVIARGKTSGNYDPTSLIFAKRCFIIVVYVVGIGLALVNIPALEIVGHSLLAGAGIFTLITGLASQQILSNVLSGILIVIFKPFRLGDRITITNMTGVVEDINLRHFVLRDPENNRIVVPNSVVGNAALVNFNHTDNRCCKSIEIGIGYTSDIDKAISIMIAEANRHPLLIDGRTQTQIDEGVPQLVARVIQLGESSVVLKMLVWATEIKNVSILYSDLLKSIKQQFDAEGIEIPYPQRTISYSQAKP